VEENKENIDLLEHQTQVGMNALLTAKKILDDYKAKDNALPILTLNSLGARKQG
jgi:hypothetical protein